MTVVARIVCFVLLVNACKASNDDSATYKYVTSYNRGGRIMTKDKIEKTSVNVLKPIIFIIGGLTDDDKRDGNWSVELSNAYTEKLISNVFVVDWNITAPLETASINKAHSLGLEMADFIEIIFNKTGESYLDIHLIGVGLGCEVAASAAKHSSDLYGKKVNRITGLDPSYYLINGEKGSRELSSEKANFVDVVHSNLNKEDGELEQIGHADFYVDGADEECETKDSDQSQCNELKSTSLFAKSVNSNDITATKCDSLENFRKGLCEKGDSVTFGENVGKEARGKYFLKSQN